MNINKILEKYNPTFPNHYKQLLYISHDLEEDELVNYLNELIIKGGLYIACEISISSKYTGTNTLIKEILDDSFVKWLEKTSHFIFSTKRPKPKYKEIKQFTEFLESYSLFNFKAFFHILSDFHEIIIREKNDDMYYEKKVNDFFEIIFRETIINNRNISESSYEVFFLKYLNIINNLNRINHLFILIQRNLFETFAFSSKKNKISFKTEIALQNFETKFIIPKINDPNPAREHLINYLLIRLIIDKNTKKIIPKINIIVNNHLSHFLHLDECLQDKSQIKKHLNYILKLKQLGFLFDSNKLVETIKRFLGVLNCKIEQFKSTFKSYEYYKGFFKVDNVHDLIQIFDFSVIIFTKTIGQINSKDLDTVLHSFFVSISNFDNLKIILEKDSHIKKYFNLDTYLYEEKNIVKNDKIGKTIKIDLPPYFEGFIPKHEFDSEISNNLLILNDRIFRRHFTSTKSVYLNSITKNEYFILNRYSICHPLLKFELFFINQIFNKLGLNLFFPFQDKSIFIKEKFEAIDIEARSNSFFNQPLNEIAKITKKFLPKIYEDLSSYFENNDEVIYQKLQHIYETNKIVKGKILFYTNKGFAVGLNGILGFLPVSQIIDSSNFFNTLGLETELEIINLENRNIILSQKSIFNAELLDQKKNIISKLQKGFVIKGTVKNITPYGAFIDLGGIDGLIHINDLSWGRVSHPEEIVELDQKLDVVILDFENDRIALGLKQLQPHPWGDLDPNIKIGDKITGKIVLVAEYGAFIEIAPGIEGLIHVSEMTRSKKMKSVQNYMKVGDNIEAKILTLNRQEFKMTLSVKYKTLDIWKEIENKFSIGSVHKAKVFNITNYGVFMELKKNLEGLMHISDIFWNTNIKHPNEFCEIGDEFEVMILEIKNEKNQISLGKKQLDEYTWGKIVKSLKLGSIHFGTLNRIKDNSGIILLQNNIEVWCDEKHLFKKNGTKVKLKNTARFKIININHLIKKIYVTVDD